MAAVPLATLAVAHRLGFVNNTNNQQYLRKKKKMALLGLTILLFLLTPLASRRFRQHKIMKHKTGILTNANPYNNDAGNVHEIYGLDHHSEADYDLPIDHISGIHTDLSSYSVDTLNNHQIHGLDNHDEAGDLPIDHISGKPIRENLPEVDLGDIYDELWMDKHLDHDGYPTKRGSVIHRISACTTTTNSDGTNKHDEDICNDLYTSKDDFLEHPCTIGAVDTKADGTKNKYATTNTFIEPKDRLETNNHHGMDFPSHKTYKNRYEYADQPCTIVSETDTTKNSEYSRTRRTLGQDVRNGQDVGSQQNINEEKSFSKYVKVTTKSTFMSISLGNIVMAGMVAIGALITLVTVALELQQGNGFSFAGLLDRIWQRWRNLEDSCGVQNNITTMLKQVVFLSLSERVLLPSQHLTPLYTLMFCSIVTYCFSYAAEIYLRQEWNLMIRMSETSSIGHLALSTTNIVLEWTKAVTFMVTVVFLLLMLGMAKGLQNYTPTWPYILFAGVFWITSEKVCRSWLTNWCMDHRLDCFDTLEELYLPLVMVLVQLILLLMFTLPCFSLGHLKLGMAGTAVARLEQLQLKQHYQKLSARLTVLSPFQRATTQELSQLNDRCAICLTVMTTGRITSCQHYYHSECLLQLLGCLTIATPKCPICQTHLVA